MNILKYIEKDKEKIIWIVALSFSFIGLLCFMGYYFLNKEKANQIVTVERVTGKYTVTKTSGPSPFIISIKDNNTNKSYENVFISIDCPQYNSAEQINKTILATRYTNINIETQQKTYFIKGAYEQLCINKPFNPQSGNNYYLP